MLNPGRIGAVLAAFLALPGCVQLTFAWADLKPKDRPARPPVLSGLEGVEPAMSAADWHRDYVPAYRDALEAHVYGTMPDASETRILSRRVINDAAFNGAGVIEEIVFDATATFNGETVAIRKTLGPGGAGGPGGPGGSGGAGAFLELILPKDRAGPAPVIIMETFCARWSAVPDPAVARPPGADEDMSGFGASVATYVFGRFICTPPYEALLEAGYAVAVIGPHEIVPDRSNVGLAELARLSAGHGDDETRWGAIAAWGWAYSRAVDVLETDDRLDRDGFILWGHSRYGKAALVAAAFDPRVDGVIAHQSGTGGASLNREKPGESIASITESYPHWFARQYAAYGESAASMPIDQHMLLALIAPRPVLLGNARRDVWSDPNGAFRAAMGADAAYELLGARGLTVDRLDAFDPSAELSFWIRPGTHGVVEEDWPAFLEFLNAHFAAPGTGG